MIVSTECIYVKSTFEEVILMQKALTFIPFNRNHGLVNRDEAFKALDRLFTRQSPDRSAAIWGLGGCGYVENNIYHFFSSLNSVLARPRLPSNMPIADKRRPVVLSSGFTQILRPDLHRIIVILARSQVYHQI